jgi:hypothetical protein
MMNKWWLTSRTTQNTYWKHKNFTVFPLILRKSILRKRVFSQRKRRKWPIISLRWISKFWGYLCRTSDGSHPEPHKTRLRNIKISPFFIFSSEKSMLRYSIFSQRKSRKRPIFQEVWIQIFEVIY